MLSDILERKHSNNDYITCNRLSLLLPHARIVKLQTNAQLKLCDSRDKEKIEAFRFNEVENSKLPTFGDKVCLNLVFVGI